MPTATEQLAFEPEPIHRRATPTCSTPFCSRERRERPESSRRAAAAATAMMAECRCLSGGFLSVSPSAPLTTFSSSRTTRRAANLPRLHLRRDGKKAAAGRGVVCMGLPPLSSPSDPFLHHLADAARSDQGRAQLADARRNDGGPPPLLDMVADSIMMAAPAQVERSTSYNEHRPRRPPPDLPSLLLNSRIVYIGMPLVPAVTELVIAELLYLQWLDPRQPSYIYLNSTGTSRADGETVGMETEGFAIYDTMQQVRNEMQTVGVGAAIGQACLLLAAGEKGRRYMLPHATAMIQQPRLPSTGQMSAIDVHIRAREVIHNRDTLVTLLAKHTGNSFERVAKVMERPFYMNPTKAVEFGVADKILWRGQEAMAATLKTEEWDQRAGIRVVQRPSVDGAPLG